MEVDFNEIERAMKSNKKVSSSTDIGDIKAKVMSWLMRNGNVKKLAVVLSILLITGLVNIITGVIHNTYYLQYFFLFLVGCIIGNEVRKKVFKKKQK